MRGSKTLQALPPEILQKILTHEHFKLEPFNFIAVVTHNKLLCFICRQHQASLWWSWSGIICSTVSWLRERVTWIEACTAINHSSGPDGPILPIWFFRCVPQETSVLPPYHKSSSNQACTVKMAGWWPHSFFGVFIGLDSVSFHNYETHRKKWTWSISSHVLHGYMMVSKAYDDFCSAIALFNRMLYNLLHLSVRVIVQKLGVNIHFWVQPNTARGD